MQTDGNLLDFKVTRKLFECLRVHWLACVQGTTFCQKIYIKTKRTLTITDYVEPLGENIKAGV